MRPTVRFLNDELIQQIIDEAVSILCTLGVRIHNPEVLSILSDHGCQVDRDQCHTTLTEESIETALKTTPKSFKLFDVMGNEIHDYADFNVSFTPGSTALNILDYQPPPATSLISAN